MNLRLQNLIGTENGHLADTVLKRNFYQNDGQNITSQPEMTVKLNDLFTTVGSSLAADLPSSDIDPLNYMYLKR